MTQYFVRGLLEAQRRLEGVKVILRVLEPVKRLKLRQPDLDGTGHSRTAVVNGESVALTSLSTFRSVFFFIALLNSSISFLISRKRFEFWSSGETGL